MTEDDPPHTTPDSGDPEPETAASVEDLATLLGVLRIRRGEPSLRTLERRARAPRSDGRRSVALSRSTVSAILNAERLPSHDVLVALLDALDVATADQPRWLTARARIAESRSASARSPAEPDKAEQDEAEQDEAEPPETAPHGAVTARLRVRRRWVLGLAGATALVLAGVAVTTATGTEHVTGSVACVPESCAAASPKLALHGRLTGEVPADRVAVLMIRVDSTQRWYLGPSVVEADWSRQVGVGNPAPQPHDRYFTICLDLLPATAIPLLAEEMMTNAGTGLATSDLPAERQELACRPATRVQNS